MLARASCLIAGVFFATAAHAGAWVLPKGQGLIINQATYYTTDHYFDAEGTLQSQPRFTKFEYQPYLEYGISDRITLGGSAYFNTVSQSGTENSGLADPEIFARGKLWSDERQVLSFQPLLKLPSYYGDTTTPRAGSKSTDLELSLLYGRNQPLVAAADYLDFRLGYRTRDRTLADQLRVDASLGVKWSEALELIPALRGVVAINPRESSTYSENGEQDYGVMKAELKGLYHFNRTQWFEVALFKPVLGMQTGDGYGLTFGYAQRF